LKRRPVGDRCFDALREAKIPLCRNIGVWRGVLPPRSREGVNWVKKEDGGALPKETLRYKNRSASKKGTRILS